MKVGITRNREKTAKTQNSRSSESHTGGSSLSSWLNCGDLEQFLEQIRLPLCVHYFLLTFAKRWSSWPWEIDEGPKMSLYVPGLSCYLQSSRFVCLGKEGEKQCDCYSVEIHWSFVSDSKR